VAAPDARQFPCPQCGADTKFAPGTHALACEHCGAQIEIADHGAPIVEHPLAEGMAKAARGQLVTGGREIQCKTCGARAVTTGAATRCAFCDSAMVVELTETEATFLPESVLPFRVDAKSAGELWSKWLRSRWFAPRDLGRRAQRDGLDGCYLPYWTYDADTLTSYRGERGEHYWDTETYTDSDGKTQTRSVQKTRWYHASGQVDVTFDDVLVPASQTLPRSLVEKLEPWDLVHLEPFDPRFLAGFLAERYTVDLEPGFAVAQERMEPDIKKAVRRDIGGDEQRIHEHATSYLNATFKHLLLPLWIASFRYKDKVYRTTVNAQTGEVAGERPYSAWKITLFVLAIVAVIVAIVLVIMHFQHDSHRAHQL
jgi:hypothetical protein